jgi:hypothetical protein
MVTKKETHIYYSFSIFNGVKICSPHVSKNQQERGGRRLRRKRQIKSHRTTRMGSKCNIDLTYERKSKMTVRVLRKIGVLLCYLKEDATRKTDAHRH